MKYCHNEIWDSREQFDAFGERLMPVLKDVGIEPGEPEMLEIHKRSPARRCRRQRAGHPARS
jgi:hypothetical protein